MLYAINGSLRFNSHLFETNPIQNGTANVVPDDSWFATLISFNTGQLLGFSVKLLDLPAKAAHILYDLHVVLDHLVRNDIVRGLRRRRTALFGKLTPNVWQEILISAASFEQVIRQAKARYITGLSATVTRQDGHHPIIFMQCGPVRYRVDDRQQAASRSFTHKVIVRRTGFALPTQVDDKSQPGIQEIYGLLTMLLKLFKQVVPRFY